jgi:hypothetical protein
MKWSATIANALWVGGSLPAWRGFQHALNRPAETQQNLLRRLLRSNAASAYGRAHHFDGINKYKDFARRVPLVDYEDLAPWIDRICRGEARVLTNEPVTHLIPTSGSSGARKLIPFTAGLQREFNRAVAPWMTDLAGRYPEILFGPAYWSITPAMNRPERESSAVPVGFADDASYLGGVRSWLVRAATVIPGELSGCADLDEFRCRTLLCLLRQRDLRLISVWHPSFLILLLDALPENWDKLLAQLHQERSHRAKELKHANPLQPETLWPRLRVISCWGDGHAELSLPDLRRRFPDVFVQAKGLLATEAFVTIPFAGMHPLAIRSHFFEFVDERGVIHPAQELLEHETYEVVVTTSGGLWRYRMRDRIQVTGFLGRTPCPRFIGRSGNVCDLFGEKLSESFVGRAIQETLADFCAEAPFALLAPDEDAAGSHYTLYLEGTPPGNLAEALDRALCQNPQYAHCRDLGQLQSVRVFAIAGHGYEAFAGRLVSDGRRLGDIKPAPLSNRSGWSEIFSGDYVKPLSDQAAARETLRLPCFRPTSGRCVH